MSNARNNARKQFLNEVLNHAFKSFRKTPAFTHQYRLQVYTGVVKEALEQRSVTPDKSLIVFLMLREELKISEREHEQVIDELLLNSPYLMASHLRQISDSEMTIRRPNSKAEANSA